jgi:hypothetical protein
MVFNFSMGVGRGVLHLKISSTCQRLLQSAQIVSAGNAVLLLRKTRLHDLRIASLMLEEESTMTDATIALAGMAGLAEKGADVALPSQEIHAMYPSARQVPAKADGFIDWLQGQIGETWWSDPQ